MADSILYYPRIALRDPLWVKSSLLLWDKIYRIVPPDQTPEDHPEIDQAVAAGFIREIKLEPHDLQQSATDFEGFLERVDFFPDGLNVSFDRVHPSKIDQTIYPELAQLAKEINSDGYLELPEGVARGYMFHLANTVARRRKMAVGTDSAASWSMNSYFAEDGNFDDYTTKDDADGFYCSLVFNELLPMGLGSVSMDRIVQFVEARRDERAQLRSVMETIEDKLRNCDSADHAEVIIADSIMDFDRAKDDYRKSMEFFNPDDRHSALVCGLPVAFTAFGALGLLANPFSLTAVGGSLLMGGVAALVDYKRTKEAKRAGSPASYLVEMETRFESQRKGLTKYASYFEEFMND